VWVSFAVGDYLRTNDWRLTEVNFDARFPGLPAGTWGDVLSESSAALSAAQNLYYTDVTRPLSDVLAGAPQPAPTVEMRTIVEFENSAGRPYWITIRREFHWTDTVGEAYAGLIGDAEQKADQSGGKIKVIEFVPPLRFPRPPRIP